MKGMTVIVLMWEEAAIKDDVIEYDIAFNIIYIMRTSMKSARIQHFVFMIILLTAPLKSSPYSVDHHQI